MTRRTKRALAALGLGVGLAGLAPVLSHDARAWCLQQAMELVSRLATPKPSLFPEVPKRTRELTVPTSISPAKVVLYLPPAAVVNPPVHVNFHGGGFVMPGLELDDDLCRYLAREAGVVVVNVDYVLAPQHRAPAAPKQAWEVVRWVAGHGAEQGWDGSRVTVGGQSAGGALAAAVARQALEDHGPRIALQVLHYPPLDLGVPPRDKHSPLAKPLISPGLAQTFDDAYAPTREQRLDRLVSPANAADAADLTGIAPALVITPVNDTLHDEAVRYADRLAKVGALVERVDVADADHGYDMNDRAKAEASYARIAAAVRAATGR